MLIMALLSNIYITPNGALHIDNVAIRPTPGYECTMKLNAHKHFEIRGCTLTKD